MGIRPSDFDEMTVAQFIYAWFGWADAEQTKERAVWERQRWAVYMNMVIQIDKKDRLPMTQMFPMPWDNTPEHSVAKTELTLDERRKRAIELTKRK